MTKHRGPNDRGLHAEPGVAIHMTVERGGLNPVTAHVARTVR